MTMALRCQRPKIATLESRDFVVAHFPKFGPRSIRTSGNMELLFEYPEDPFFEVLKLFCEATHPYPARRVVAPWG
jgi:hypothetical protein